MPKIVIKDADTVRKIFEKKRYASGLNQLEGVSIMCVKHDDAMSKSLFEYLEYGRNLY